MSESSGRKTDLSQEGGNDLPRLRIIELELESRLQGKLSEGLSHEIAKLERTGRRVWSVVRAALLALMAALALVGWFGWTDIRSGVDQELRDRLDEFLAKSPPAAYETAVARLYDSALVRTYATELPLDPLAPMHMDQDLHRAPDTAEWTRMAGLLLDPAADEGLIEPIVRIIDRFGPYGFPMPAATRIVDAISAEPPHDWLRARPRHWAALVRAVAALRMNSAGSGIRDLIELQNTPVEVRIAALEVARKLTLFDASAAVRELLKEARLDRILEFEAYRTLATLDPNSQEIASVATAVMTPAAAEADLVRAFAVVSGINTNELLSRIDPDEIRERRTEGARLLTAILEHHFWLEHGGDNLRIRMSRDRISKWVAPNDLLLSDGFSDAIGIVTGEWIRQNNLQGIVAISRRLSLDERENAAFLLQVRWYGEGHVILSSGVKVPFSATQDGFWFTAARDLLQVHWLDSTGVPRSSAVARIDEMGAQVMELQRATSIYLSDANANARRDRL